VTPHPVPVRRSWRRGLPALLLLAVTIVATHELWLSWVGRWLAAAPDPRPSDAIVILGSSRGRADRAAELYLQGFAPEIWHTGDAPVDAQSDARAMARRVVERGVPPSAIRLLASTSTWEDGAVIAGAARERGARRVIIVTDWYHSRRALCVIRQQLDGSGVTVAFAAVDSAGWRERWWVDARQREQVRSELLKLVAYWPLHGLDLRRC
jgi:uncharacterized SAM-binding protein YcdF (DUF218 family)